MPRRSTKKAPRKKPAATLKSENSSASSLLYGFVFIAVIGFGAFIYYLETQTADDESAVKTTKNTASQKSKKETRKETSKTTYSVQQQKAPERSNMKYEFYGVLPNIEIEDDKDYSTSKTTKPTTLINSKKEPLKVIDKGNNSSNSSNSSNTDPLYLLQISAFQSEQKAEALRAQLGFMGVQSNIAPIKSGSKKLYRVRIGPSRDKTNLNRFKKILQKKGFKPILQEIRV